MFEMILLIKDWIYPGGASCASDFFDCRRSFRPEEPMVTEELDEPVSVLSLSLGSLRTHSRGENGDRAVGYFIEAR